MRFENGVGHKLFAVLTDKTRKKYRRVNEEGVGGRGGGERKRKIHETWTA
jgi:hypothetical protein